MVCPVRPSLPLRDSPSRPPFRSSHGVGSVGVGCPRGREGGGGRMQAAFGLFSDGLFHKGSQSECSKSRRLLHRTDRFPSGQGWEGSIAAACARSESWGSHAAFPRDPSRMLS